MGKVSSRDYSSIYARTPKNVTNIRYSPILVHSQRIDVHAVLPLQNTTKEKNLQVSKLFLFWIESTTDTACFHLSRCVQLPSTHPSVDSQNIFPYFLSSPFVLGNRPLERWCDSMSCFINSEIEDAMTPRFIEKPTKISGNTCIYKQWIPITGKLSFLFKLLRYVSTVWTHMYKWLNAAGKVPYIPLRKCIWDTHLRIRLL